MPKFINYLWIVEGPFNLWSLSEWRRAGVALLGTGTEHQYYELLKVQCEGYVLALDPDDAGRKGTNKIGKFLQNHHKYNIRVALLPDGKDVNDLTEQEFKSLNVVLFNEWQHIYNKQ